MSSSLQVLLSISGVNELLEVLSRSRDLKCSLNTEYLLYLSITHVEGGHFFIWPMEYGDEDIEEYRFRFNLDDTYTYNNWFCLDVNGIDCVLETLHVLLDKFVAGVYNGEFSTLIYNDLVRVLQNRR